ncbi:serine threonine- kinase gin4 [Trichoderma cornu-damae]|uniref:non-specific serine/threonine protein kinase n=1 Tax=Trichoderma cornu-damae TaxID=654480 RepID=A0A9P8QI93_9HYPO|nr:serine threonine- kinase gin4 [Trichoderma cornu-damae]
MAEYISSKTRSPLAETTNRLNAAFPAQDHRGRKARHNPADSAQYHGYYADQNSQADTRCQAAAFDAHVPVARRPPQSAEAIKRLSQASYASTSSSQSRKNYKTHIGPWQLGRTLGKGSSARVRLCRHSITNQLAAVKIVNRRMAYLVQESSLAALSKWDSSLPEVNGEMRVPVAIEREVAILKLIEHPNIMKLYDIWENRSEIYLILEYIDQGDLFTFINTKGRLSEEVAIYFFRQMISAIAYCHSFNVCHRDLKPENILITADLQIKIADFGMAALHQTATHRLATACGSPHYAAPELLKNQQYRGDRADIWSMGVILYAMLSATLPFDDPDLRVMMGKTKKGQYEMPKFLSPEAEDLIRRMLQVNPDHRITMKQIWQHPLIQRYNYLDDFGQNTGQPPDTRKGFQYTPIQQHQIDPQLLRQLRSLWHMFSDDDLEMKLGCKEPNDQKAFYWLLHNYREQQLEDFKPELSHSMSDYHHLKPNAWKKRVSTCEFSQPRANGHGRSISRFTVISTAAETEAGTIQSYDPYRGSRMLKACGSQASHARITVHRDGEMLQTSQSARRRSGSNTTRRRRASSVRTFNGRPQSSRGSMSSLHSNRQGTPQMHGPGLRHKRGVDFSHVRKRSSSAAQMQRGPRRSRASSIATDGIANQGAPRPRSPTPEMPQLPNGTYPRARGGPVSKDASLLFNEELRHFSNNIAKDCDDAFRSSLMEDDSFSGSLTDAERKQRDSTPFSLTIDSPSEATAPSEFSNKSWSSRPLPPLPLDPGFKGQQTTAVNCRPVSRAGGRDKFQDHVNRLALPVLLPSQSDRRVVSAPYGHASRRTGTLPCISENPGVSAANAEKARIVSAPPHTPPKKAANRRPMSGVEYLNQVETSIRVVTSPTAQSPVKIPEPLNVRKKVPKEDLGQPPHRLEQPEKVVRNYGQGVHDALQPDPHSPVKKKKSWFKRSFKIDSDDETLVESKDNRQRTVSCETRQSGSSSAAAGPSKKRNFSFPFWKSNRNRDSKMIIEGEKERATIGFELEGLTWSTEHAGGNQQMANTKADRKGQGWHRTSSGSSRNIEVKQNWLTRLFRVKPATSYICMTLPRKRARQEVAALLREWRKYGIRSIQVDRERNIVFARVGAKNCETCPLEPKANDSAGLNLKEVAFAAEVMKAIEHGKKQQLSIVRFTQERGAASSFHKVVDTMRIVFADRSLVVEDQSKQKMMIKTLNS